MIIDKESKLISNEEDFFLLNNEQKRTLSIKESLIIEKLLMWLYPQLCGDCREKIKSITISLGLDNAGRMFNPIIGVEEENTTE